VASGQLELARVKGTSLQDRSRSLHATAVLMRGQGHKPASSNCAGLSASANCGQSRSSANLFKSIHDQQVLRRTSEPTASKFSAHLKHPMKPDRA